MATHSNRRWGLIDAVVAGDADARATFCTRVQPLIRRYLESRWRGAQLRAFVCDAVQEVIFECLRPGGALTGLDRERCSSFNAYLRGVVRNVASRVECREARYAAHSSRWGDHLEEFVGRGLEPLDDLRRAAECESIRRAVVSLDAFPAAGRHSLGELVRLHFREGLPVRRIAAMWQHPASQVHELRRRACRELRRLLTNR